MNQNNIKPQELLTGKALKSFKAYIKKENGWTSKDFTEHYKCQGNNKYTCADIVDWLDSVGIYISICKHDKSRFAYWFDDNIDSTIRFEDSRHEATQEAIKKAVEIYNNRSHEQQQNNR